MESWNSPFNLVVAARRPSGKTYLHVEGPAAVDDPEKTQQSRRLDSGSALHVGLYPHAGWDDGQEATLGACQRVVAAPVPCIPNS